LYMKDCCKYMVNLLEKKCPQYWVEIWEFCVYFKVETLMFCISIVVKFLCPMKNDKVALNYKFVP
jgi:hypothetical protein